MLGLAGGAAAVAITFAYRAEGAAPDDYPIFLRLFAFNDHAQAIAGLVAFAAALALPFLRNAATALASMVDRAPLRASLLLALALAVLAWFVGQREPFSMDEYAAVFQAHAFASGALTGQFAPSMIDRVVFEPFQGAFLLVNHQTGAIASAYWPGFALLLAPAAAAGLAWIVNPLLTAAAVWLIGELAARSTSMPGARGWAMLAAVASPQLTVNAAGFYAMPGLLALNLSFMLLLMVRDGRGSAFAAGLLGGWALSFHNPVPHALLAAPVLAWMLFSREQRARLPFVLLGYLPLVLVLGFGWDILTKAEGLARQVVATPDGAAQGWLAVLGGLFKWPSDAIIEARFIAAWKTWIWAAPGLVLLTGIAVARLRSQVIVLGAVAFVLTWAFYFLVPFDQGHGWGFRYLHPVWGLLPIACGVWAAGRERAQRWPLAAACAAGLLATPVYLQQTAATLSAELGKRIEAPAEGRWVRFVADQGSYAFDRVQNFPGQDRVLTLVGTRPADDAAFMARHFPGAQRAVLDARGSLWRLPAPRPDPAR